MSTRSKQKKHKQSRAQPQIKPRIKKQQKIHGRLVNGIEQIYPIYSSRLSSVPYLYPILLTLYLNPHISPLPLSPAFFSPQPTAPPPPQKETPTQPLTRLENQHPLPLSSQLPPPYIQNPTSLSSKQTPLNPLPYLNQSTSSTAFQNTRIILPKLS